MDVRRKMNAEKNKRGAGRPTLPTEQKGRAFNIYLLPEDIELIESVNTGGTISASVRELMRLGAQVRKPFIESGIYNSANDNNKVSIANDIKPKGDEDIDKTTGR